LEEYRRVERLRYEKKKEKKQVKLVSEMDPREHRLKKQHWKVYSKNYREKNEQIHLKLNQMELAIRTKIMLEVAQASSSTRR